MNNINQHRFLYPLMLLTCWSLSLGPISPANAQSRATPTDRTATATPSPSSTTSASPGPRNPAVTTTDNPMAQTTVPNNESSLGKFWPWISMALHGIELLGLVTFLMLLKDFKQKSQEKDHKRSEKIAALENSLREQQAQLSNLDANVQQSKARLRETMQNFPPPSAIGSPGTPATFLPRSRPEQAPAAPIANREYPFMELYQQNTDAFKHQYSPTAVSEDSENLQRRWAGEQQEIILGEDRQGNYWLVPAANNTYLIPSPKLKLNDMNMRTAGGLFECTNYHPGYRTMTVVKPAIVSVQAGMGKQRWKLEQKGVLEFT